MRTAGAISLAVFIFYVLLIVSGFVFDSGIFAFSGEKRKRVRKVFFIFWALLLPFFVISVLELSTSFFRWDLFLCGDYEKMSQHEICEDYRNLIPVMSDGGRLDRKKGRTLKNTILFYRKIDFPGFHTNRYGLRCEVPEKNKTKYRIGIFGGSTVWGSWVTDDKTLAAFLEKRFKKEGIKNVEVFNMGIEGMTFPSSVRLLEMMQPIYKFDEAVFYLGVNDFFWKGKCSLNPFVVFLGKAVRKFRVFRLAVNVFNNMMSPEPDSKQIVNDAENRFKDFLESRKNAVELCSKENIKSCFLIQPALFYKDKKTDTEEIIWKNTSRKYPAGEPVYRTVVGRIIINTSKYSTIDLTDTFNGIGKNMYQDWCHLNSDGNRIVADMIFEKLKYSDLNGKGVFKNE